MIKKNIFIKGLILGFMLIISTSIFSISEDYRYKKAFKVQHLSIKDGLSLSVVQDIIQDESDYIWLATEDGLNRFDSYDFKIFRHDHKDINSLHENVVVSLVEEPGQGIWVGTASGPSFYNPTNSQFTDHSQSELKLNAKVKFMLYSKEQQRVWFASDQGLYFFDRKSNEISFFTSLNGIQLNDTINSLTETKQYLYVASDKCLFRIDKSDNQIENLCELHVLKFIKSQVRKINVLNIYDDDLWIGTTNGVIRFNTKTKTVISYHHDSNDLSSISDNYIQDIKFTDEGGVWISTTGGLNFYDQNKEKFRHYKKQFFFNEGLSSNDIVSLHIDKQGLIWLGTYGGGLNILDPNQHKFERLLTRTEVIYLGNNNIIHGIEKDQYETLWFASFGGGLLAYDQLTGKVSKPLDERGVKYNQNIWALNIDYLDRLWVATLENLKLINVKDQSEIKVVVKINDLIVKKLEGINRIVEDQNGTTWLGLDKQLLKVESEKIINGVLNINFIDYTVRLPKTYTSQAKKSITSIIQDQNGDYWFGGSAGLIYYKVKTDEWIHYFHDKSNPQSLINDFVQVIYEDSHGFIWVGTGDGLNRIFFSGLNKESIYFERITTEQGLSNNSVYSVLEDDDKQLWLSSNLGLMKYSKNKFEMELYRESDGLSSDEFNFGAYFSDSDGRLYFGSINGITIVNKLKNQVKYSSESILFTKVSIDNRSISINKLNNEKNSSITVEQNESTINIQVANLNFDKLGTQKYRYRLLGLSDSWNYLSNKRDILLAGLFEGKYELEIQSQLTGMDWVGQTKKLNIIVKTSFWNSVFAYYLIGLIILTIFIIILFIIIKFFKKEIIKNKVKLKMEVFRVKALKINNDMLKKTLDEKQQEIISLHHSVEVIDHLLDIEKFRDVTTGFYHISYLYRVYDQLIDNNKNDEHLDFSNYKEIMILQLTNYTKTLQIEGPLIAAELLSKVSVLMRKSIHSQVQVYYIKSGQFLFMGGQLDAEHFEETLSYLSKEITRTQFELANGFFSHTQVNSTFINTINLNMTSKDDLIAMVNLLIKSHSAINEEMNLNENITNIYRLKIDSNIFNWLGQQENFNFKALEKEKLITKQKIE